MQRVLRCTPASPHDERPLVVVADMGRMFHARRSTAELVIFANDGGPMMLPL